MEWKGLSLVLFLLFINVGGAVIKYIPTGGSYTFLSNITATIQSIQWTQNDNIVVEWDPRSSAEPIWYLYKEVGQLDIKTGVLTLKVVKKADSSLFKGQFEVKGVLHYAEYSVTVIDPLSECTVTCEKYNETHTTITCTVKPPASATFEWSGPNGFSHRGDSFTISSTESDLIYYCTAKNEVSTVTAEFKLKNCQDPALSKDDSGPGPGPIIGGIFGILIAVALGVAGWLKKDSIRAFFSGDKPDASNKNYQSGQASNSPKNEESMTLQAPNNGGE